MIVFRIEIIILIAMVLWTLPDISVSEGDSCSCYSFHGNSSSREESRGYCKNFKGDLVSMETEEELKLIQTQVLNRTKNGGSEWWIGLQKLDKEWKWITNHTLTYNTSLRQETEQEAFVTIATNTSSNVTVFFKIILDDALRKGWICEYKGKVCSPAAQRVVCQHLNATTTKTPSTPSTTTSETASTTTASTLATTKITTTKGIINASNTFPALSSTQKYSTITTNIPATPPRKREPKTAKPTAKVAKLTSAAPTTATATTTKQRGPFFDGSLTTTSAVRDCLPDQFLALAISVTVFGATTVIFFTSLFLFIVLRKKFSKPRQTTEKAEVEEGEYENHL